MSTSMPNEQPLPKRSNDALADPAVRRFLEDFVRRRAGAGDVDDIVQTVLCDALAAENRPDDAAELRKWLVGIARHKVADHHRKTAREPASELPDLEASPAPIEARELARWAEDQAASVRDAQKTLAWMAREGEGEKLESIAADENVPAARVRQRVSRMRRWMKERWLAEVAMVAALAIAAFIAYRLLRNPRELPEARPELPPPVPSAEPPTAPLDRARALRADALKQCDEANWQGCLDKLDEARAIDPAGDADPSVAGARARARDALVAPAPTISAVPDGKAPGPESATPSMTSPSSKASPNNFKPTAPAPTATSPSSDALGKQKMLEEQKAKKSKASKATTGSSDAPSELDQKFDGKK